MAKEVRIVIVGDSRSAQKAIKDLESATKGTETGLLGLSNRLKSSGDQMANTGKKLSLGLTLPLAAIGFKAIQTATDFEKTMNTMRAVAGVPQPQMEKLRALAIKLGADTVFSANDAGKAMLELSKAGVSTADIMGGALKNALDLAAAGDLDLANAAEIAANAMNVFGLTGRQSQLAVDALAGAANASSADVADLALALAQGGSAASSAGFSIQETTAALAAFADAGIRGSDAGTSLKTFLLNLVPTTDKARNAMQDLGISFIDNQGNIMGLTDIAGELKDKLGGLTQAQQQTALKTIFGTDAFRAANIVMKEGEKGIAKYIKATSDQGAAAEVAAAKMKGLPGAIEQLKGSIETLLLNVGNAMAPFVEGVATTLTGLANGFSALPAPVQTATVAILALAAAVGPLMFVVGNLQKGLATLLVPMAAFTTQVRGLQAAAALGGAQMGVMSASVTVLSSALSKFSVAAAVTGFALLKTKVEEVLDSIGDDGSVLGNALEEGGRGALRAIPGLSAFADHLPDIGRESDDAKDKIKRFKEEAKFQQVLVEANKMKDGFQGAAQSVRAFVDNSGKALNEWKAKAAATFNDSASVMGEFAGKAKLTAEQVVNAFQSRLDDLKNFKDNLRKLMVLDLNKVVFQELVDNADSGGAEMAAALAKGGQKAVDEMNKAHDGIGKVSEQIPKIVGRYIGQVPETVSRAASPARGAAVAVGQSIGDGMVMGIKGAIPAVDAWAVAMARSAVASAKAALGSKSPSKVFEKIGKDVVLGFADGIRNNSTTAMKAVENMTNALIRKTEESWAKIRERMANAADVAKSGFAGFKDLSDFGEGSTAGGVVDFLKQQREASIKFVQSIQSLINQGLNKTLLQDIVSRGPEALPLLQALSTGGSAAITDINRLFSDITKNQNFAGDLLGAQTQQQTANIYFQIDSRTLASALAQPIVDEIYLRTGLRI